MLLLGIVVAQVSSFASLTCTARTSLLHYGKARITTWLHEVYAYHLLRTELKSIINEERIVIYMFTTSL
jgi:hypothetical protein